MSLYNNYYLPSALGAGPMSFIFVGCKRIMFSSDDLLGRCGGGWTIYAVAWYTFDHFHGFDIYEMIIIFQSEIGTKNK